MHRQKLGTGLLPAPAAGSGFATGTLDAQTEEVRPSKQQKFTSIVDHSHERKLSVALIRARSLIV